MERTALAAKTKTSTEEGRIVISSFLAENHH